MRKTLKKLTIFQAWGSDHLVLMFQYNCCIENNSNISEKYNFNKGDYSACRDLLGTVDWNIRMDGSGISESWTGFAEVIVDAIKKNHTGEPGQKCFR